MSGERTVELVNVGIRKISKRGVATYTQAYADLMRQVGKCIKAGGHVEFDELPNGKANCKLFWKGS